VFHGSRGQPGLGALLAVQADGASPEQVPVPGSQRGPSGACVPARPWPGPAHGGTSVSSPEDEGTASAGAKVVCDQPRPSGSSAAGFRERLARASSGAHG
jgi:hypothetical protein